MKKYTIGKLFIYFIKKKKCTFKVFIYETNYVEKAIDISVGKLTFIVGLSK